jgi:hypothetical protein
MIHGTSNIRNEYEILVIQLKGKDNMGNLGTNVRMTSRHVFKKLDMIATWDNVFRCTRRKLFDLLHFLESMTQFFLENTI